MRHRVSALEGELQRFGTAERRRAMLLPVNRGTQTARREAAEMFSQTPHVPTAATADAGAQTDYLLRGDRALAEAEHCAALEDQVEEAAARTQALEEDKRRLEHALYQARAPGAPRALRCSQPSSRRR